MAEKLEYINPAGVKESVMKHGWLKDFGSFNRIPQPFVKIDNYKFSDIAKRGTPDYIEHRQLAIITESTTDKYVPSMIFWYNDTGIMTVFDDNNLMEFYQLGCQHNYDAVEKNGRTDMKCTLCGFEDVMYDMFPEMVKEEKKV